MKQGKVTSWILYRVCKLMFLKYLTWWGGQQSSLKFIFIKWSWIYIKTVEQVFVFRILSLISTKKGKSYPLNACGYVGNTMDDLPGVIWINFAKVELLAKNRSLVYLHAATSALGSLNSTNYSLYWGLRWSQLQQGPALEFSLTVTQMSLVIDM